MGHGYNRSTLHDQRTAKNSRLYWPAYNHRGNTPRNEMDIQKFIQITQERTKTKR